MAYQTRGRDPLLDSNMQAMIEKRGKELLGIGLAVIAVLAAMVMASYSPDDPSFLSATDAPVQNWLGHAGASVAAPIYMIVGLGGWMIPAALAVWAARFVLHWGEERALPRVIFVPVAVALLSIYTSTLEPAAGWQHSFGMGGLFGDTVLAMILRILPFGTGLELRAMSVLSLLAVLGLGAYVLGFIWTEVRTLGRLLLLGMVMLYSLVLTVLGRGAQASRRAAQGLQERRAARRSEAEETLVARAEPVLDEDDAPQFEDAGGFKLRLPGILRRGPAEMPEPELVEPDLAADPGAPADDDRIKARINDVIKSRVRAPLRTETDPIKRAAQGRGPQPLVAQVTPRGGADLPPEPPVTMPAFVPHGQPAQAPQPAPAPEPEVIETGPEAPTPDPARPVAAPVQRPVVQHPPKKPPQPSTRARAEAQPALQFDENGTEYEHPPLNLLTNPGEVQRHHLSDEALEENARMLETVLDDYGVKGEIVSVRPGPVVTMYELEPAPGLKASRVIGLADDIARSMSALSARVSTVPGRSVIGIELPNEKREMVVLREMLAHRDFGDGNQKLPLALGKDIGGDPVVANLAKMPHLLIAGTTGSGKSVAINTMILSLLYKLTPEECRLIMIDPKMLELSVYDGIPHLLSPVVTDPKKAVVALKWVVAEMEERYRKMSKMGVRNIEGYNGRVKDAQSKGEMFSRTVQTGFDEDTGDPIFETEEFAPESMPYIVVIVDEMADLMMVAGKEIEACIQRLAQMARASGIHLIMATQRPSVDVITGTIKANFPTRISFQVTSKVDSRTILGEQGAEQLLGMGDMLYMAGGAKITRVHGPFVSDEEVEEIVSYLKQFGPPDYKSGVVEGPDEDAESSIDAVLGLNTGGNTDGEDALYDQAVAIVAKDRKCSTSYIQRKLAIGYNKAARLVEQMEDEGVVSAANHVGKREVLIPEA